MIANIIDSEKDIAQPFRGVRDEAPDRSFTRTDQQDSKEYSLKPGQVNERSEEESEEGGNEQLVGKLTRKISGRWRRRIEAAAASVLLLPPVTHHRSIDEGASLGVACLLACLLAPPLAYLEPLNLV